MPALAGTDGPVSPGGGITHSFPYSWGVYLLGFPSLDWHRRGAHFWFSLPDAGLADQVLWLMSELLQWTSRNIFQPRNAQTDSPDVYSGQVLALRPEMLKMSLLRPILARFSPWGQKCSKWASWGLFWPGSGPETRNAQNEPPEAYSGQFLVLGPEMLKRSLPRPIRANFGPYTHLYV